MSSLASAVKTSSRVRDDACWEDCVKQLLFDLNDSENRRMISAAGLAPLLFGAGGRPIRTIDVEHWRDGRRIPYTAAKRKLLRLRQCLDALVPRVILMDMTPLEFFGDPCRSLGNVRPVKLLGTEDGTLRLLQLITGFEIGRCLYREDL